MSKKSLLASIIGAMGLAMAAVPSAAQTPNADGATVRFQVFEAIGDMLFRVMETKFCQKYGLKCEAVRIASGPAGIQALSGKSIEVSFITTDAAIRAIVGGAPVKVVHGQGNRVPFYFVARSDLDRPKAKAKYPEFLQDYKGKRIGVTGRGAGTELIAQMLLKDAGLSPTDVTFVAVGGPPTAFGMLQSKQVDAVMNVPPLSEICDESTVCQTVMDIPHTNDIPRLNALTGSATVVLMNQEYIVANPKVVEAWLAAARDADAWMRNPANFEESFGIAKKFLTLKVDKADAILRKALQRQNKIADVKVSVSSIDAYSQMLFDGGLIPKKPDASQIVSSVAPIN
ncbi:MAG: ABC transporter substrate-binding protein [Rhodocyclales bacterium]|nr:ABC transporter substrate-binding protein [Rhodocyclales bacterium]